jgi:hypothetical protein
MARREVQSTSGAHGDVGGAIPWPEAPVCVEVLLGGNGGTGWLAADFEQRTTVWGGDNGKLIDFEAEPDGGWSRWSSMRWLWKRWWAMAAWRLEPTRTEATL